MTRRAIGPLAVAAAVGALLTANLFAAAPAMPATVDPDPSASASPSTTEPTDPSDPVTGTRPQTITLSFLPDVAVGTIVEIPATASSDLDVTLAVTGSCEIRTVKRGTVVVATGAGECDVVASQAGDETFAPADDVDGTFIFLVGEADVDARVVGGDVVEAGAAKTVSIDVNGEGGSLPAPSGTVSVEIDGKSIQDGTSPTLAVAGAAMRAGTPSAATAGGPIKVADAPLHDRRQTSVVVPGAITASIQPGDYVLHVDYLGDDGYSRAALAALPMSVVAAGPGDVPPPTASPVADFVDKYRPIRGFSYEPSPSNWASARVPFDSDYYNDDFSPMWGPGGRDDIKKMASIGTNLLHIYNWNPQIGRAHV